MIEKTPPGRKRIRAAQTRLYHGKAKTPQPGSVKFDYAIIAPVLNKPVSPGSSDSSIFMVSGTRIAWENEKSRHFFLIWLSTVMCRRLHKTRPSAPCCFFTWWCSAEAVVRKEPGGGGRWVSIQSKEALDPRLQAPCGHDPPLCHRVERRTHGVD